MASLNELLLAESTEYEFKSELEVKKPKSWLKTVSAFANGSGGRFFYGVSDDGTVIGLDDTKITIEQISKLIQTRISPLPDFNLKPHRTDGEKTVLLLEVQGGEIPPFITWATEIRRHIFGWAMKAFLPRHSNCRNWYGVVKTSRLTRCPPNTN
jgi:predicted HTH transcriptional regulator